MKRALAKTGRRAPGKIEDLMIRHPSERGLSKLLALLNKVLKEGQVPVNWKEAIIILIREPGKDSTVKYETTKIQEYIRNMAPKE